MFGSPLIESEPRVVEVSTSIMANYEMSFWSTGTDIRLSNFEVQIDDPIHGRIVITPPSSYALMAPVLMRSDSIYQLASTRYINFGASHSRLSHQAGVRFISIKLWDILLNQDKVVAEIKNLLRKRLQNSRWNQVVNVKHPSLPEIIERVTDIVIKDMGREIVGVAALLHDIGHGGWGHILDALNGDIFFMIKETLEHQNPNLISPALLEIRKLDITSATFVITNSESLTNVLEQGFTNYLDKLSESETLNDEVSKHIYDLLRTIIKWKWFIPSIITSIIAEDLTVTARDGRLWSLMFEGFSKIEALSGSPEEKDILNLVYAVMAEALSVVAMLGIQIIGDVEGPPLATISSAPSQSSAKYGFNADRLDWVARDVYHLGICNRKYPSGNINSNVCTYYNRVIEFLEKLRSGEPPDIDVEINTENENMIMYISPQGGYREVHEALSKVRKHMYDTYHHNKKSMFDSILIRLADASIFILWRTLTYKTSRLLASRSVVAHILNDDATFLATSTVLLDSTKHIKGEVSTWAEPVVSDAVADILKHLFSSSHMQTRDVMLNFYKIKRLCKGACTYALETLYALAASGEELTTLARQPYVMTHLKKYKSGNGWTMYGPIKLITPGGLSDKSSEIAEVKPDKTIILVEIKLSYPKSLERIIKCTYQANGTIDLKSLTEYLSSLMNSPSEKSMSMPLLEFLINSYIRERFKGKMNYIYVNHVHYSLKDLIEFLEAVSGSEELSRVSELLDKRPLLHLVISMEGNIDETDKSEMTVNDLISLLDGGLKVIIDGWMAYNILSHISLGGSREEIERLSDYCLGDREEDHF